MAEALESMRLEDYWGVIRGPFSPPVSSHIGSDASRLKKAQSKDRHHTYFRMTSHVTWRAVVTEDACPRTVAATSVSPVPPLPRPSLREQLGGRGSRQLMFEVLSVCCRGGRRDVCQARSGSPRLPPRRRAGTRGGGPRAGLPAEQRPAASRGGRGSRPVWWGVKRNGPVCFSSRLCHL